jgi:hypothetical protein
MRNSELRGISLTKVDRGTGEPFKMAAKLCDVLKELLGRSHRNGIIHPIRARSGKGAIKVSDGVEICRIR